MNRIADRAQETVIPQDVPGLTLERGSCDPISPYSVSEASFRVVVFQDRVAPPTYATPLTDVQSRAVTIRARPPFAHNGKHRSRNIYRAAIAYPRRVRLRTD
jgi:hypothetical protein